MIKMAVEKVCWKHKMKHEKEVHFPCGPQSERDASDPQGHTRLAKGATLLSRRRRRRRRQRRQRRQPAPQEARCIAEVDDKRGKS